MNPDFPEKKTAWQWLLYLYGDYMFFVSLLMLVVGLSLSPFLVGFSQFNLIFQWIITGKYRVKLNRLKERKVVLIFLLLPLVHVLWLFNTTNFSYAFHDLKIKLPLIVLPVILGSWEELSYRKFKSVLLIFAAAVIVSTLVSFSVYLGLWSKPIHDIRDISIIISHIRLGLMIDFAMLILLYFLAQDFASSAFTVRLIYVISFAWLLFFVFILQSVTSWITLFLVSCFIVIWYYKRLTYKWTRIFSWIYVLLTPTAVLLLFGIVIFRFYNIDHLNEKALPVYTVNGNRYENNLSSKLTENGHYVWVSVCWKELKETWPTISRMPFNGTDAKGQPLRYTIIRYLTSKNLNKDSLGLKSLDKEDIKLIERGKASCVYRNKFTPYVKTYDLVWELDRYLRSGNPNGKTLSMRIEFLKAGIQIIRNHLWFGVGTGDVRDSFKAYYTETSSQLNPRYRLNTHNQFVTLVISFGLIGSSICFLALILPVWQERKKISALGASFIIIAIISFLSDDMMESQAGVTFFVFFYSLFIFLKIGNRE